MSRDTAEAPLTTSATWQALAAHHAANNVRRCTSLISA